jgi:hypothetical protein
MSLIRLGLLRPVVLRAVIGVGLGSADELPVVAVGVAVVALGVEDGLDVGGALAGSAGARWSPGAAQEATMAVVASATTSLRRTRTRCSRTIVPPFTLGRYLNSDAAESLQEEFRRSGPYERREASRPVPGPLVAIERLGAFRCVVDDALGIAVGIPVRCLPRTVGGRAG